MRSVVFTADTEEILLEGLGAIPGYKLSRVQEANRHPLILVSLSGSEVYLRHSLGSTSAATSNILPQDHEATARPIEEDEATKLSQAAAGVKGFRAILDYSNNDRAKLSK